MEVSFDLTIAWALLLAITVYIYVVLDGFDLGLGILYPFFPKKKERDLLMNSVAPVWDGNETWLVLGGGGLFAAFPLAYSILMPALYPLIIAMVLGLVFRGVAFEFRWRTKRWEWLWDTAFIGGSIVAALCQGIILGAILQGVEVEGRSYAGGWLDWLTPFSVLVGVGVLVGYAFLGATWLNMKCAGQIQKDAKKIAKLSGIGTVAFIVLVSAFTPFLDAGYAARWLEWPSMGFAAIVPIAVAAIVFFLFRALQREDRDWLPFVLALLLFLLCFAGLGISMWPFLIPTEITIWDAASPYKSQLFMFVGAIVLIPIILIYTAYAYWVFRGKMDPDEGYH